MIASLHKCVAKNGNPPLITNKGSVSNSNILPQLNSQPIFYRDGLVKSLFQYFMYDHYLTRVSNSCSKEPQSQIGRHRWASRALRSMAYAVSPQEPERTASPHRITMELASDNLIGSEDKFRLAVNNLGKRGRSGNAGERINVMGDL